MKKSCPIYYLPPAEQDLEEIFDYIRRDSLARASKFLNQINRVISQLASFPHLGVIPKDNFLRRKGYRILVIRDCLVFYRVEKNKIFIHRILHGRRRYKFLLE